MVNGLEAQVCHPQPINVRVSDADRNVTTAMALVEHLFVGDARERTFAQKHELRSGYSREWGGLKGPGSLGSRVGYRAREQNRASLLFSDRAEEWMVDDHLERLSTRRCHTGGYSSHCTCRRRFGAFLVHLHEGLLNDETQLK